MRRPTAAIAATLAGTAMLIGLKYGTTDSTVQGAQAAAGTDVPAGGAVDPGAGGGAAADAPAQGTTPTKKPRARKPRAPQGTTGNPGGTAGGGAGGNTGGTAGGAGGNAGGAGGNAGGAGGNAGATGKSGTFAGAPSSNQYGTWRITVTVANGKLTNVAAVYPTTPALTASINAKAIPTLKQEALAAQSAKIATVSGATFTSSAYRASLQSALSKAGI